MYFFRETSRKKILILIARHLEDICASVKHYTDQNVDAKTGQGEPRNWLYVEVAICGEGVSANTRALRSAFKRCQDRKKLLNRQVYLSPALVIIVAQIIAGQWVAMGCSSTNTGRPVLRAGYQSVQKNGKLEIMAKNNKFGNKDHQYPKQKGRRYEFEFLGHSFNSGICASW